MEPTILLDPPLESAIMTEEIFGPLLPIITVTQILQNIHFFKSILYQYLFTHQSIKTNHINIFICGLHN
jgi:acyl-CoA reductase-like NAD-dependent aldehyde dehydrogenase